MFVEKEVALIAIVSFFTCTVAGRGDHHEGVIYFCFVECSGEICRANWIDVFIDFSYGEHQFPFEPMGLIDVGLSGIMGAYWIVHPLLVPPDFVDSVVMAATVGDGNFVKVVEIDEGTSRTLPSRRASIDAYSAGVHLWVELGRFLDPLDAIRKSGVG